jgi:transmembrane sensor
MNIIERVTRRRRTSKAGRYAAWAVSGEMTADQEKEIQAWCAADANNRAEMNRIVDAWANVGGLSNDPDIRAIAGQPTGNHDSTARGRPRPMYIAAAAAILLLLSAIVWHQAFRSETMERPEKYFTAIGERTTVQLADGSRVSLNTNSQVIVDFSSGRRRTILDRGEVFFDIARDPARPFVVELGSRAITVLGTKFNVQRVYNGEVAVAVVEGVVAVHRAEDAVSLTAPVVRPSARPDTVPLDALDQYRIEKGSVITLREIDRKMSVVRAPDVAALVSWQRGLVRFDATPLHLVARELNRYTERRIIIEDPRVLQLEVNAVLNVDQMDTALKGLERVLPIQVRHFADHIEIVSR